MNLKLLRSDYYGDTTIGLVQAEGKFFGYCLEDAVRPTKIKGKTAIPAGKYEVVVTMSNRFKREMPLLVNVPNYEGIRIHGGNTHLDTDGCLLIARNRLGDKMVQGSLETTITDKVKADTAKGVKSYIEIFDTKKV